MCNVIDYITNCIFCHAVWNQWRTISNRSNLPSTAFRFVLKMTIKGTQKAIESELTVTSFDWCKEHRGGGVCNLVPNTIINLVCPSIKSSVSENKHMQSWTWVSNDHFKLLTMWWTPTGVFTRPLRTYRFEDKWPEKWLRDF